ncbi:MAG: F420-dependent methylenetetrahydromethanopterin dehydrogenase [Thaumarchaeota archaeon]|nr:F420-dependent methylenetetrahydromethanopterin dehydrogenase [Nitrososphaerota archaeon]
MRSSVRVTIVKLGSIASTALIESLLDERASREDIVVKSFASGTKMDSQSAKDLANLAISVKTDTYLVVSPNASLNEPKSLAKNLSRKARTIVISDSPAKKAINEFEKNSIGYVIIEADSLIGVRKEFLDPVETALFNSDVIKVLAVTGAFRALYEEIDRLIESVKKKTKYSVKLIIDKETAVNRGQFSNPYAKAKAMASFEMAKLTAKLSAEGAYKVKERDRYLTIVSSAHELMRVAALLADQAREIEKYSDQVIRYPHMSDGNVWLKKGLFDKAKQ